MRERPVGTKSLGRVLGVALAVSLVAACTGGGSAPTVSTAPAPTAPAPTAVDLVVSPHPDDELEAWSLIGDDTGAFTVFLTLTHGESTVNCTPAEVARNTQEQWGEIPPDPIPQGPGTASCKQARIGSWNAFLDSAAAVDPRLPTRSQMSTRTLLVAGHEATMWWSDRGARVAVDGGDGSLTERDVRQAVTTVLARRGAELPDLPVRRVVGAAYTNDPPARGDADYASYRHPDHWAVRNALLSADLDAGTEDVCVTTWPTDPARTKQLRLDDETYQAFTGLGGRVEAGDPESLRRVGSFQRIYGWLAFPRSYWPQTDLPVTSADGGAVIMAQRQTFTCR